MKPETESYWASFVQWFDSHAGPDDVPETEKKKVDWVRAIPFYALHLACLGVIWVGWSWTAVLVAAVLYAIRMFAVTGFYHRYFSHRTFKTSRPVQFLFGVLGNSAVQRGPLWWAANHRHHHRHSDREEDIHSPIQDGFYWSHFGWITSKGIFKTKLDYVRDLAKFPELRWLDRFDNFVPLALAIGLFGFGELLRLVAPGLGTTGPQLLIWGFFISTVVLFHGTCTINSLAHTFGRRRYETTDHSRNSLILALITLGEGWHNNHHHFPASTRQGFFWWEVDLTYYVLVLFSKLGLIWDLRGVPEHVRSARRL
ncbi:MAG: acyl-CoA desaturase [Acidobacteriota bacterium]|nr:MAG: acyl-CoA desaturase [Acidobacteriota bacterium]